MNDVTGLILTGGRSRRFGTDKALYEIEGQSMIERVYDAVSAVADPVWISVRDASTHYDLPARHVADEFSGCGPLAGIHAGLKQAQTPWVLVVACDLPYLTPHTLRMLLHHRAATHAAVIARTQPLCGCYACTTLPSLETCLNEKRLAVKDWVTRLPDVKYVDLPATNLRNINTP